MESPTSFAPCAHMRIGTRERIMRTDRSFVGAWKELATSTLALLIPEYRGALAFGSVMFLRVVRLAQECWFIVANKMSRFTFHV